MDAETAAIQPRANSTTIALLRSRWHESTQPYQLLEYAIHAGIDRKSLVRAVCQITRVGLAGAGCTKMQHAATTAYRWSLGELDDEVLHDCWNHIDEAAIGCARGYAAIAAVRAAIEPNKTLVLQTLKATTLMLELHHCDLSAQIVRESLPWEQIERLLANKTIVEIQKLLLLS